ncbi:MAG: ABC transporter permease [Solirubrobacteraceae bacterium]|jgi:peptide/nickel transport system permease protein
MAIAVSAPVETVPRARRGQFLRSMPTKAKVGGAILLLFLLIAIIGPALAPYDPSVINSLQSTALAPNAHHLLGTAPDGGDIFSQLLVSIRGTVELGVLTASIATLLSVSIGVTSGFLGGAADEGLSLLTNVFLVLPALPLLIVVLGYFPHAGVLPTALVLSVLGWSWGARVIRAQTLTLRGRDFIAAARETGERTWRLVVFEVLPNQVSLIAANFVGTFLYAILTSVALAFIGEANLSSWTLGVMLYWAQSASAINIGAWWMYLPPGLAVAILGMSLVLLNFGLDELGNPRLRASSARRAARRTGSARHVVAWRPTDPTPVQRVEAAP